MRFQEKDNQFITGDLAVTKVRNEILCLDFYFTNAGYGMESGEILKVVFVDLSEEEIIFSERQARLGRILFPSVYLGLQQRDANKPSDLRVKSFELMVGGVHRKISLTPFQRELLHQMICGFLEAK